jgi:aspartyl-tRNA(Asn)/glutamyl-tRNA(Gln) amidotransferase subunit A
VAPALSPGGSSSGPAVAVAAGLCPLGLGTDLSGSVRIPAAYCGIVGFKPASADVPREGCVATAPSYDAVGVLAASVDACLEATRPWPRGRCRRPRRSCASRCSRT